MEPSPARGYGLPIRLARFVAAASVIVLTGGLPSHEVRAAQPRPTPAARTAIDVTKLGPQVGQVIPEFTLSDQNGKAWTKPSIMGPKGAMIVFYRSADW